MKLYSHPVQPNAIRVLMFIAEKGIDLDIVDLNMLASEHKTEEYLKKNSRGQVPTLAIDDGLYITESIVICRYLDEVNGAPYLFGRDAKERATISMWERSLELGLFIPATEYAHHTMPELKPFIDQYPDWAESLRPGMNEMLRRLDQQLEKHKFIAGEKFSVADITGFLGVMYAGLLVGIEYDSYSFLEQWAQGIAKREGTKSFHIGLSLLPAYKEAIASLGIE